MSRRIPLLAVARDLLLVIALATIIPGLGMVTAEPPGSSTVDSASMSSPSAPRGILPEPAVETPSVLPNEATPRTAPAKEEAEPRTDRDARVFLEFMARASRERTSIGISVDDAAKYDK